jgi:AbiV family abortive infection protein
MSPRSDPEIPRIALRDGIVACLTVASLRLEETDVALRQGLLTQAGVVFTFAVEEFGKAALLKQAFESGTDPVVIDGFYDHRVKLAAAIDHVGPECLLLTPGGLDLIGLSVTGFTSGRRADLLSRMSGLYVDWQNGWVHGLRVDAATLAASSAGLQSAIQTAMIKWT